jgi:hypothetical protein
VIAQIATGSTPEGQKEYNFVVTLANFSCEMCDERQDIA